MADKKKFISGNGDAGLTGAIDAPSTSDSLGIQALEGQGLTQMEVQTATGQASGAADASPSLLTAEEEAALMDSDEPEMPQLDKLKIKGVRLTKAQRKRYKWLREHGHEHDKAAELCTKTIAEREGRSAPAPAVKRVRSDDSTPKSSKKARPAGPSKPSTSSGAASKDRGTQKPSYSGALGAVKIGIIPVNFPQEVLTAEQMTGLEDRLARLILSSTESPGPRFRGLTFRVGHIVITCENEAVAEWVKRQEKDLQLPELKVRIVEEKDIPSPYIVTGFFPNSLSYSTEEIRSFIATQNGLPASQWRCLKTTDTGKNCKEVVLAVDHASYDALKAKDFVIAYRFGTLKLHPKKDKVPKGTPVIAADSPAAPEPSSVEAPTSGSAVAPAAGTSGRKGSEPKPTPAKPWRSASDRPARTTHDRPPTRPSTSRGGRAGGSGGDRLPLLRQERVVQPSSRNRGKPWKHQKESRNERN